MRTRRIRYKGPSDEEISLARIKALGTNGKIILNRLHDLRDRSTKFEEVLKCEKELEFFLNEVKITRPNCNNRRSVREKLNYLV